MGFVIDMSDLRELTELPAGLLQARADELDDLLGGPTLIHLQGELDPPLFVSVLLHGDETSGWESISRLLQQCTPLRRSLSLFIGNTAAAKSGVRRLDHQADYNRCWPGTDDITSKEAKIAAKVVDIMANRGVFASVDIHNNSGSNPVYACVNRTDPAFLALAGQFSHTVVFFTQPAGVQSAAFAGVCPSVVLECAQAGSREGIERSIDFIAKLLGLSELPDEVPSGLTVYHTIARVEVPPEVHVGTGNDAVFRLPCELESLNFKRLSKDTCFGYINSTEHLPVRVTDTLGREVTTDFFHAVGNQLRLRQALTPAMISTHVEAIRKDCLCYLMEPLCVPSP